MAAKGMCLWTLILQLSIAVVFLIKSASTQFAECGSLVKSQASCYTDYSLSSATNLLSVQKSSKSHCLGSCMQTEGCKSVNFNTDSQNCNHLGSSRRDLTAGDFVRTAKSYYCEIEIQQETKPRSTASSCRPTGADCVEILNKEYTSNRVYSISPTYLAGGTINVVCDMENGGWIVIQRRFDGSENFDVGWSNYRQGFGSGSGEFWLGLDKIQGLTNDGQWTLRVELEDWHGNTGYAEYSSFTLDGELYTLNANGYSGNIGDSFGVYHNNQSFSTWDNDNDNTPPPEVAATTNCALTYRSGWWYDYCLHSNLNGWYYPSYVSDFNQGIQWEEWNTIHLDKDMNYYSMKSTTMKIRKT